MDLYTHSMVRKVTTDDAGKATGVSFVSKVDMKEYKLKSRVVVLGASSCETTRIMLNSKSKSHPNGIGADSGVLGRYLHDSTGASRSAIMPDMIDRERYNEDGVGGMHMYTPWWLDNKKNWILPEDIISSIGEGWVNPPTVPEEVWMPCENTSRTSLEIQVQTEATVKD